MMVTWVVTFTYLDGHIDQITGKNLIELIEQARKLFDKDQGTIINFEVEPEYPAEWPSFN
jgi:hypothetical protein